MKRASFNRMAERELSEAIDRYEVIRNPDDQSISLDAKIEFLDADGFVVDEASAYDLSVAPHVERTFTGFQLIRAGSVDKVKQVHAKLKPR